MCVCVSVVCVSVVVLGEGNRVSGVVGLGQTGHGPSMFINVVLAAGVMILLTRARARLVIACLS